MAVLNMYHLPGKVVPANAVYVGRPSPWGNPYQAGRNTDGMPALTREQAVGMFRQFAYLRLANNPTWLEPLRGKDLVCWCAPKECHADVLMELMNGSN